jgi:hypothetical protein
VSGAPLIILGVILLIIGFVAKIAILWTIGIVVVVIGVSRTRGRRPEALLLS